MDNKFLEESYVFDIQGIDFTGKNIRLKRNINLAKYNDYETEAKSVDWKVRCNSEDTEFDIVSYRLLKTFCDRFILTATSDGLSRYEKILGIDPGKKSLDERRREVFFLWNKQIRYTDRSMRAMLDVLLGKSNYRMFLYYNEYGIEIEVFVGKSYKADGSLYKIVRQIIPANLDISIKYGFVSGLVLKTQYGDYTYPPYLCGEELCGDIPWEIKADNKVFKLRVRTENYNSNNYYALPSDDLPTGVEFEDLVDETIFIQDFSSKDIYEFKDKEW